jgi:hypothetical protein
MLFPILVAPEWPHMPKTDHRRLLTPTMIEKLRPKAGWGYQVMDSRVPGFGVRVRETGPKTFIFRTRYPSKPNETSRRELGRVGVMTLVDAREKAGKWRTLVDKGIDPARQEEAERAERLRKQKITFRAVVEDFIREKLPSERKGKDVEREIRRDLMPVWEAKAITDITDLDVIAVISAKAPDGKTGARNLLALIKRFFRWAVAKRIYGITESPCQTLSAKDILGEGPGSRDRILSDDEIFAFWRATERMAYPVGPAYQLLIRTALRLREATGAQRHEIDALVLERLDGHKKGEAVHWRDIPADRSIWTIPKERMKGKKSGKKQARAHAVPMTDEIVSLFASLPRFKGRFLFSTTKGRVPVSIGTKVKQELDDLMLEELRALAHSRGKDPSDVELPHWVNHDLRRTVRSHLSRLKIEEVAREALLAHARPGIKGVYDIHDYREEKREALQLWAARLRTIVEPTPNNVVPINALKSG